jgi:large subunit ribosomal protein L13
MQKIERKLHKLDATDQAAGRLATQIAMLLRGKHKPEYVPNIDAGDIVEVKNIDKLKFSGKKLEQKKFYHYSGYPGGIKTTRLKNLNKLNPADILRRAVKQMLPGNRTREAMLKRLIIR